jgi:PKHD-type hydroxylase
MFSDVFSDEEIKKIHTLCQELERDYGKTSDGEVKSTRECSISWIDIEDTNNQWIVSRMGSLITEANKLWNFDVACMAENLQYTIYDKKGDHYTAHTDLGNDGMSSLRKISVVVFLDDDFEGGELEIFTSDEPITVNPKKGVAIVFPSYLLHQVRPVTKGTRRTLVCWFHGFPFR